MGLQKSFAFCRDVKQQKVDFHDIISVKLAKFMVLLRLWLPKKEYENASLFTKLFMEFMFYTGIISFAGSLVYLILFIDESPSEIFVQKIANILVIYVGVSMQMTSRVYRNELSEVIQFTNEKTMSILKRPDYERHRPERNSIYIRMIVVMGFSVVADFFAPVTCLFKTLATGELYYKNVLVFVDVVPYSLEVYLMTAWQLFLFYYIYMFCSTFIIIIVEPFLRLSMCYRLIALDIRALRSGETFQEDQELAKLRRLLMECNEINLGVQKANDINSPFFVVYVSGIFVIIGLFFAVSLTMSSPTYIAFFLLYPCNLYIVSGVLCALGQSVMDSAHEIEVAIYDCNWYTAPLPFKKLLLMFMIRCKKPITISGKPFYVLNLGLFTRITNNIYMMIALARKFI